MARRRTWLTGAALACAFAQVVVAAPTPQQAREGVRLFSEMAQRHHPEPYRLHDEDEWRLATDGLAARAGELSHAALYIELSRLVGMLGDGHSYCWIDDDSQLLSDAVDLAFWPFADGVFVRAAAEPHADLVGAQVLAIGGVPIDEAFARLCDARPGETPGMTGRTACAFMRIPAYLRVLGLADSDDRATFTLRFPDGSLRDVTGAATDYPNMSTVWLDTLGFTTPQRWVEPEAAASARWMARRDQPYWRERIREADAVYVQFNASRRGSAPDGSSFSDGWLHFVDALFEMIDDERPERLVIDMRHNNGGDSQMWQPLTHALIRRPWLDEPGRVFVLIGPMNESAAVATVAKLESETNALFIGEPTGSRPNYFNDPRHWSKRDVYHVPGSPINFRVSRVVEQRSIYTDTRSAIWPDIEAQPTFRQFAAGEDPALTAALTLPVKNGPSFFVDDAGTVLLEEPWTHPWRGSQNPAWETP